MEKLSSSISTTKLEGEVKSDGFYIKAGLKGRLYHDEIVKIGRKPRKREPKPWRGRDTFDNDQPMITCIHQRNIIIYFDVPSVKKSLLEMICNNVEYGSTIFTDEYRAYDSLEEHGFVHINVNHSEKDYANGTVHVNNCECRSNPYLLWIGSWVLTNIIYRRIQKHFSLFIIVKEEPRKERKDSWEFFIISS